MKQDIKQKIVDAALRLIEKRKSRPEDITVRDICAEAGVALSQINYHFQTKENLIAQCVQKMIGDVIGTFPAVLSSLPEAPPMERLKGMMRSTLKFLYDNENISRVSILTDHHNARQGDNTSQTIDAYTPLVETVCRERNIEEDPRMLTMLIVLTLQGMFLRTEVIRSTLGVDLRSETDRAKFVSDYIDRMFQESEQRKIKKIPGLSET
jgi:AcrR family transcriptional regulator